MAYESAMPAESVNELLEMARTRQLSGRLTIRQQRRGSNLEGEVYLQAGWPVSARLGSMVGQEAMTRLVSWRDIQYIFQPEEPGTALPGLAGGYGKDAPSYSGPGLAWPVPHRRDVARDVLTLLLTRRQRVMYLLVDGHRTLADLSRCSGKTLPGDARRTGALLWDQCLLGTIRL
jgi:hypothetical protein